MRTRELDAQIRKAVEADIQQWLTNSLTPDRGYQTPIDNVRALVMEVRADALRHAAAASRNTFSDPHWHGFYHDAVERVATELEAEAERIVRGSK